MKVAVYTLGCKVNRYESRALLEQLLSEGFEEVRSGAFFGVENTEIVFPSTVKSLPRACFYALIYRGN